MSDPAIAALLLAGGKSKRMGQDKAFLPWQGKPLWQVQLDKLRTLKPVRLLIACREGQGLHQSAEPEVEWLFDPPESDCGPIGPVIQALEKVQMPLLVLAVDMPHMTPFFLRDVLDFMPPEGGLFFTVDQGCEPLAGVYTPAMLPLLTEARQAGRFSLRDVLGQAQDQGLAVIPPVSEKDALLFTNANTPDDWAQATT